MHAIVKQEPVGESTLVTREAGSPGSQQERTPLDASSGMLAARAAAAGPYPQWPAPSAAACHAVVERLAALHGLPSRQRAASGGAPQVGCEERRTVLDSLVRTLLSQNTTDKTSARAFASLKQRFPSWQQVAAAPLPELADAIRVGGLADIKASRIQAILHTLAEERGELSLEHLRAAPPHAVHAELGRFKGVGKKTIACVQLFALGRPDFAVDTHVWDITKALGWAPSNCTRDQAYDHLNARVPDELKYDLHVLLVRHGKACPACAKAGSAKAASAAAKAAACPLAELKPPRSQLKAASPAGMKGKAKGRRQRQQGEDAAAPAPAPAAKGKQRQQGEEAAAPAKGEQRQVESAGAEAGSKRRKVET